MEGDQIRVRAGRYYRLIDKTKYEEGLNKKKQNKKRKNKLRNAVILLYSIKLERYRED